MRAAGDIDGDIDGAVDRIYADLLAFAAAVGLGFDHVLHVRRIRHWLDAERFDTAGRS
ncbi:MAG: hypothetical protein RBU45_24775 [Myxococcota bacterium]|nr:hypothetical protein [Myxococcota bacterium]